MNSNPKLSYAGTWQYSNAPGADIITFYSQISLGSDKSHGIVLAGWSFSGSGEEKFRTTNAAVFDQNSDGTLKLNTKEYIQDPTTNGAGSVIVNDFNGDGIDDIFLVAYGESPFVLKPSTAYISSTSGNFQKLTLGDATNAHSATIGFLDGKETIVTAGYLSVDNLFQFNDSTGRFDVVKWANDANDPTYGYIKTYQGASVVIDDFDSDGLNEVAIGELKYSPGVGYDQKEPWYLAVYKVAGTRIAGNPSFKTNLYFDNSTDPLIKASDQITYRLWSDDFNHDGKTDILAGVSLYPPPNGTEASKLVLLQNEGSLEFTDKTDSLGSVYRTETTNVDYSMQLLDIDHSGIKSYLLGDSINKNASANCNYLLVNDGTGSLHIALHEQFLQWGSEVKAVLDSNGAHYNPTSITPRFMAYQLDSGEINYLAQWLGDGQETIPFVNVPVQYKITTDFKEDITISDRNQSMLMRTWAGNDKFYDSNANTSAHIDGGLGFDVAVYSDKCSNYLTKGLNNESFEVHHIITNQAPNVDDTLVNIERLQFSDTNVALDIGKGEIAGEAYRIYKAAFDRAPDAGGLGFWINAMDDGASLTSVAAGFINSPEFQKLYGANVSDRDYVTKLYNNVLDRNPDQGGYDFWLGAQANGATREDILVNFSESKENIANVADLIANGIQYQEWLG